MLITDIITIMLLAMMVGETVAEEMKLTQNLGLYSIADVAFLVLFVKVILLVFRFSSRFPQVFCAAVGVDIGFNLLFLPLQYLTIMYGTDTGEDAISGFSAVLTFIYIAMFIWLVRVLGNIFLHALEVRLSFAIGITLLYLAGKAIFTIVTGSA